MQRTTITQIYTPVTHSNGNRLVQITTPDGAFCGWADGTDKYGYVGTWEIDTAWAPVQAAQLAHVVQGLRDVSQVTVTADGVTRRVTSTL